MANKTPVGRLQELCTEKGRCAPIYNEMAPNDETKTFYWQVDAFNCVGNGDGKTKKEAKHNAAADLLNQLKLSDHFKELLTEVPESPTTVAVAGDAVSSLLDKCVTNEWPIAEFNELQGYGAPHAPEFMIECRLGSLVRIGKFKTKKGAKQLAAQSILNALHTVNNTSDWQLATIGTENVMKKIRTYRELKNSDIKNHEGVRLKDRHKYLQKHCADNIEAARKLIMDTEETAEERVALLCRALGFEYKLEPLMEATSSNFLVFELGGNYDCVISGNRPEIFTNILNYFGVMLNIQKY